MQPVGLLDDRLQREINDFVNERNIYFTLVTLLLYQTRCPDASNNNDVSTSK